jgi:succinoglycan biosynthesis protein ExoA
VLVSVVVPCRNEVAHIHRFLQSVLSQRLPEGMSIEVVVADGSSDDGTREALDGMRKADQRIVLIENPQQITSAALNRAIARAEGDVIVRMDVHTTYADDYVARCVEALRDSEATCVGGAWRPVGTSGRQLAIALAFQSRLGSGGAASRRTEYEGPVDTVYLGAWRREDLVRLGGFDETLVRNQDDELNLRIVRSGGRVWQSKAIRSWYTPRGSLKQLFRQFYQYGYWKVPVIRKHRMPASPRHLAPFAFLVAIGAGSILAPWSVMAGAAAVSLAGAYVLVMSIGTFSEPAVRKQPQLFLPMAGALACMHFGYGLGFALGTVDFLILRRPSPAAATRLTR